MIKVLQPGVYQFKFFVDGEWRHSPDLATVSDDVNDMINLLDVTVSFPLTSYNSFVISAILMMPDTRVVSSVGLSHPGAFGHYLTSLEDEWIDT